MSNDFDDATQLVPSAIIQAFPANPASSSRVPHAESAGAAASR